MTKLVPSRTAVSNRLGHTRHRPALRMAPPRAPIASPHRAAAPWRPRRELTQRGLPRLLSGP